jgi:hypothetical protein
VGSSWKLHERLEKLSGGAAVIRASRAAEIDVKEHKDRMDDVSLTSRNRGRRQVSRGSMKWPCERLSRNQNKSLLQTERRLYG